MAKEWNAFQIACIGAQNTGKTTFIHDFIEVYPKFKTPAETYRDVIKAQNLKVNRDGTIAHQWVIFNHLRDMYANNTIPFVLYDRSPLDAYIYTTYIAETTDGLQGMLPDSLEALGKVDLILYFPLEGNEKVRLKKDKLRDIDPNYRKLIDDRFRLRIDTYRDSLPPVFSVMGGRKARIKAVTEYLNDYYPNLI
jgi:hypothetical protein